MRLYLLLSLLFERRINLLIVLISKWLNLSVRQRREFMKCCRNFTLQSFMYNKINDCLEDNALIYLRKCTCGAKCKVT